jgi:hypothetical protein
MIRRRSKQDIGREWLHGRVSRKPRPPLTGRGGRGFRSDGARVRHSLSFLGGLKQTPAPRSGAPPPTSLRAARGAPPPLAFAVVGDVGLVKPAVSARGLAGVRAPALLAFAALGGVGLVKPAVFARGLAGVRGGPPRSPPRRACWTDGASRWRSRTRAARGREGASCWRSRSALRGGLVGRAWGARGFGWREGAGWWRLRGSVRLFGGGRELQPGS